MVWESSIPYTKEDHRQKQKKTVAKIYKTTTNELHDIEYSSVGLGSENGHVQPRNHPTTHQQNE